MSSDRLRTVAIMCALLAAAAGCADLERGTPPAVDAGADGVTTPHGDGAALSFATTVYPLLTAVCPRCHTPGQQAGDTPLLFDGNAADDYAKVVPYVDTSAPASSRLLNLMSGHGHGGGTVYADTSPEYATVLKWIQGGALP